jgi:hypothetical protein
VSAIFLLKISFVIIVGKKDIRNMFVLPSSQNESNSNYHNKICQHFPLPLNQKPRHLNLSFKFSPPRVILIRMLKGRNTILTIGFRIRGQKNKIGLPCGDYKLLWKSGCEFHHFLCRRFPCNRINVYIEIPPNHHP